MIIYFAGLVFEIAEGGFLDIDVKIMDPAGNIIYQGERESSGKFTFAAHTEGKYTYCFSNKMSTMTPKVDIFFYKYTLYIEYGNIFEYLSGCHV